MLIDLKREAYEANMALQKHGLINLTFGNASAVDRAKGIFAIKPSGVAYADLRPSDMVLIDFDGKKVPVIMQANRNGFFYVIDRANGKPAEEFFDMVLADGRIERRPHPRLLPPRGRPRRPWRHRRPLCPPAPECQIGR